MITSRKGGNARAHKLNEIKTNACSRNKQTVKDFVMECNYMQTIK